jgi:chromosomal replication initiator protein
MITVEAIQQAVSKHFEVARSKLIGFDRHKAPALARHVAFYLCRRLTPLSYPEIGRRFCGRHHTTVMFGVRRVDKLIRKDPKLRLWVDLAAWDAAGATLAWKEAA